MPFFELHSNRDPDWPEWKLHLGQDADNSILPQLHVDCSISDGEPPRLYILRLLSDPRPNAHQSLTWNLTKAGFHFMEGIENKRRVAIYAFRGNTLAESCDESFALLAKLEEKGFLTPATRRAAEVIMKCFEENPHASIRDLQNLGRELRKILTPTRSTFSVN